MNDESPALSRLPTIRHSPGDVWRLLAARPHLAFLALYALSLCACLALGLLHGFRASPLALDADEREYYDLAGHLMQGSVPLSARRTLGFPMVLAALRAIHDDIVFVQTAVAALYALSAPLLFLLVRQVSGSSRAGMIAGGVLAIWPPALFYGTSLYSEALAGPTFLLALLVLPIGAGRSAGGRGWAFVLCGLLLGVLAHVRPMYILFLPFLALTLWIESGDLRRTVPRFALAVAGFLLPILPWSLAQSLHFHHPILLASNGGETLAGGLNPKLLDGRSDVITPSGRKTWAGAGKWIPVREAGYLSPAEMALPYDHQDRILRERAIGWALENPGQAARIELSKIGYMWGIYPLAQNGTAQLLFGNLPTLALLALTLWCLALAPGPQLSLVRFWAPPLFTIAVAMISWGSWRFRQPGDAGLIAFCAICLMRHIQARSPRYPADA